MDHAATQDLYPACFFADITTGSAADKTGYIHFSAWLCEWKIRRAETNFYILAVHFFHEEIKRLLQICERYVFINIKTFYLVEKAMAARTYGFISVNTPGTYNPDR